MEERLTHSPGDSPLFSHDGIHDSQTQLAAPAFFYEYLRRQIALSIRSKSSFSAVRIVFVRDLIAQKSAKIDAEDILRFSCELRGLTRGQDCIGRLGVNECVILVGEGELAARQLLQRLQTTPTLSINHTLLISISMVTYVFGESGLNLLNRLDCAPLSTH